MGSRGHFEWRPWWFSPSLNESCHTNKGTPIRQHKYIGAYRMGFCQNQCVAVCCSVLQCVAVCCSVLQCVAVCCSVLQWFCQKAYRMGFCMEWLPRRFGFPMNGFTHWDHATYEWVTSHMNESWHTHTGKWCHTYGILHATPLSVCSGSRGHSVFQISMDESTNWNHATYKCALAHS